MTRKRVTPEDSLRQNKLGMLIHLAAKGAAGAGVKASTASLALELGVSQQTVSRWLSELAAEGLVERRFNHVRLAAAARPVLQSVSSSLSACLSAPSFSVLRGRLSRGLEEGGYYLAQKEYSRQFAEILGYRPFAGTLNLVLSDAASVEAKRRLSQSEALRIAGFSRGGRYFGGAKLFPAELRHRGRKIACAVVIPDKTHHGENILEVVAKDNLRKTLKLKEGEALEVFVRGA